LTQFLKFGEIFVFTTYMFEALVLGVLHLDNRLNSFVFGTNSFSTNEFEVTTWPGRWDVLEDMDLRLTNFLAQCAWNVCWSGANSLLSRIEMCQKMAIYLWKDCVGWNHLPWPRSHFQERYDKVMPRSYEIYRQAGHVHLYLYDEETQPKQLWYITRHISKREKFAWFLFWTLKESTFST